MSTSRSLYLLYRPNTVYLIFILLPLPIGSSVSTFHSFYLLTLDCPVFYHFTFFTSQFPVSQFLFILLPLPINCNSFNFYSLYHLYRLILVFSIFIHFTSVISEMSAIHRILWSSLFIKVLPKKILIKGIKIVFCFYLSCPQVILSSIAPQGVGK